MYSIATGSFKDKTLVLNKKITEFDGKRVKVIIFDEKEKNKINFFDLNKSIKIDIPDNYKFNQDELNER